ncbi:MAG: NYN domain-containing protein [Pseudomonadota bacterium]
MKTNIYVDGFNLYYGSLKGTPFRWLDISAMCRLLLPNDKINKIKYFTALVHPRPHDPDQLTRQQTHLRALRTIPNLTIIKGSFLSHEVMMPLAPPKKGYVKVIKTEEKGSDVNLATHLLQDAYHDDFEFAVIISNDSDLLEPIKVVTRKFKKDVGLINPQKHPSYALKPHVKFIKQIRKGVLSKSQFPSTLKDSRGKFKKPAAW